MDVWLLQSWQKNKLDKNQHSSVQKQARSFPCSPSNCSLLLYFPPCSLRCLVSSIDADLYLGFLWSCSLAPHTHTTLANKPHGGTAVCFPSQSALIICENEFMKGRGRLRLWNLRRVTVSSVSRRFTASKVIFPQRAGITHFPLLKLGVYTSPTVMRERASYFRLFQTYIC